SPSYRRSPVLPVPGISPVATLWTVHRVQSALLLQEDAREPRVAGNRCGVTTIQSGQIVGSNPGAVQVLTPLVHLAVSIVDEDFVATGSVVVPGRFEVYVSIEPV